MSKRKTFQITDLNEKELKTLQQSLKIDGITVQQASILNLAIELFFKEHEDYNSIIELMRVEHII